MNNSGITEEFSKNFSKLIGICMVTTGTLGLVGNILTIIIFASHRMRSPINTILSGLCIIDIVLIITSVPLFILPMLASALRPWTFALTTYSMIYMYPLCMTMRTSSVWLFVLITFERYLAVCFPLQVNRISSNVGHARVSVIVVVITAFSYNLVRFLEFAPKNLTVQNTTLIVPRRFLRVNRSYIISYYTTLYLLTHFLLPFILLVVFNGYIIRCIRIMRKRRRELSQQQLQEHRTTYMMITLIVTFIVTNTIPYVLNIVEVADSGAFERLPDRLHIQLVADVSNLLVLTNSSTNYVIYIIFSNRYRVHFLSYIRCKKVQSAELLQGVRMISKHALKLTGYHPPEESALINSKSEADSICRNRSIISRSGVNSVRRRVKKPAYRSVTCYQLRRKRSQRLKKSAGGGIILNGQLHREIGFSAIDGDEFSEIFEIQP